jgi:hypothetical protein
MRIYHRLDLTGVIFGRLIVEEFSHINKHGEALWLCLCSCGNKKIILGSSLRKGQSKSCGCLKTGRHITTWEPIVDGNYLKIPLKLNRFAIIDKEDLSKIFKYSWHMSSSDGHFYAVTSRTCGQLRMHRIIMDCPDGYVVDHINNDGLDNRKSNLRICLSQQNACNRKLNSNSSTGFKGVHKSGNRFNSTIRAKGIDYRLGTFDTAEEAYIAYVEKAKELHGEFHHG